MRMKPLIPFICLMVTSLLLCRHCEAGEPDTLPGTAPLSIQGDRSLQMRAGFRKFLLREWANSIHNRQKHWQRNFQSREAYETSITANRDRLRHIVGAVDKRLPITALEYVATLNQPAKIAETPNYTVSSIRWPVFEHVYGEGLLLEPKAKPTACVIAIADADQTPEMLAGLTPGIEPRQQFARRLAEAGCRVVVPVLINRDDRFSGNPDVAMTNQPHREWIYRQAYTLGRHVIGYEVQKVLSLVDWFSKASKNSDAHRLKIGVAGYAEGGLIALYSAALDNRINAAWVSGYFNSRQRLYEEPIYRNVFGLLAEFGDAEIATLIAPRGLVVQRTKVPEIDGPPTGRRFRRQVAAPGQLQSPSAASVESEFQRAKGLYGKHDGELAWAPLAVLDFDSPTGNTATKQAIDGFLSMLEVPAPTSNFTHPSVSHAAIDPTSRQQRQVQQLVEHNQRLMRDSARIRANFWSKAVPTSAKSWPAQTASYREILREEIIGPFSHPALPLHPRTRKIFDEPTWTGYEVVLDVFPDVFAWGYLLIPKNLKPGERRPVVVCQHGLEGLPADVVNEDPNSATYRTYKGFAAKLVKRGFVTLAPHNFYRGGNEFRQLQRIANPLKKTLFGITTNQHAQWLDWLSSLPFVDAERIGFYGLSYGGNTAMRVPALLEQYSVVIASGDFNEWIYKNVTDDDIYSMIYHNVWEVFEFNLAQTFNHGDLAALIAPRPFMVERGHADGVAHDEWVASEFARVRRLYAKLGIVDRTTIEFFNGPHTINGKGTFEFLEKHLRWSKPFD